MLSMDLYDLGTDYLKNYCEQIRNVDLKSAAAAARDHLQPDQLVTLVLGPAARCADALRDLGPLQILNEI
jgi:predicted Zn-dependent peptidase